MLPQYQLIMLKLLSRVSYLGLWILLAILFQYFLIVSDFLTTKSNLLIVTT